MTLGAVAWTMWALLLVCIIAGIVVLVAFEATARPGGVFRFVTATIWTAIGALFVATVAVTAQAALT